MEEPATITSDWVGRPLDRVDGRLKVTGAARYAADHNQAHCAYAVAFCSTIAKGKAVQIDTSLAGRYPGVLAVITGKVLPPITSEGGAASQKAYTPFQDDIQFHGQYLGLVVADTLDAAEQGARLVRVQYQIDKAQVPERDPVGAPEEPVRGGRGGPYHRGDAEDAFAKAAIKITQTYTTPTETHNPMEMHATVAQWEGDRLTLYDATQDVDSVKNTVAKSLKISADKVRVLSPYLGGGFGCKGSVWPHEPLAAYAARKVGRPVKFVVKRDQMFANTGHRPITVQTISLGADKQGKLMSFQHDVTSLRGPTGQWVETATQVSRYVYDCPNVRTQQKVFPVNSGQSCQMRGPGQTPGMYAMECAMDELAYAAGVDPLHLRLLNYADTDPAEKKPYTSKALRECYQVAAEKFGWSKRSPRPRSMRDGSSLIGWGMASSSYPAEQRKASATVRLFPDGKALVMTAGHDIGTGTYTIMAQIAADELGMSFNQVRVELADTDLPNAPGAGGSTQAVSVGCAVKAAAQAALTKLITTAAGLPDSPLKGREKDVYVIADGHLQSRTDPLARQPLGAIFSAHGDRPIDGEADAAAKKSGYAAYSWGAHFAEVRVDENLGVARVTRFTGAFAAGRILNSKTARSQVMGGIVMGIGMALMEHTVFHPLGGQIVNNNLADYLVPVNSDIPFIDITLVDEKDDHINPLGAKGIGELSTTGSAAAIANAVYHATGKRVRDLPITLDRLL